MTRRNELILFVSGMCFVVMIALVFAVSQVPAEAAQQGAPAAGPTPITFDPGGGERRTNPIRFFNATTMTADTRSTCFDVAANDVLDLHTVIDHGTVNTTTLKIQYSNDDSNYVDGASFISASVADANEMDQLHLFGRYACVYADVTSSDTITITAIGIAK